MTEPTYEGHADWCPAEERSDSHGFTSVRIDNARCICNGAER